MKIKKFFCKIIFKFSKSNDNIFFNIGKKIIFGEIAKIYKHIKFEKNSELIKVKNLKIWVYWGQGFDNAPALVKKCLLEMKKNLKYDVIELDENNFSEYINIPEHIIIKLKKGIITRTHFSDILRLNLLSQYGGIWIDSTCLITSEMNSFIKHNNNIISCKLKDSNRYVSHERWSSWLIGTKYINSEFKKMSLFLDYYWQKNNELIHYYLIDYLLLYEYEKNKDFRKKIDNIELLSFSPFELINNIEKKCNISEFQQLYNEHFINKLSWKREISYDKGTYGYWLKENN